MNHPLANEAFASTEALQLNDIVRLAGGQQLIIVEIIPSRPANPYLGVLVNGQGKEYKFGYKHRPHKIGVAPQDHPALLARQDRKVAKGGINAQYKIVADNLCKAVLNGDTAAAKVLATTLQQLNP